jgi:hypothetical protein
MAIQVEIYDITGQTPFDIYVCQTGDTNCFYITRINETNYNFLMPKPYDTSSSYLLKIIDGNGSVITGQTAVL